MQLQSDVGSSSIGALVQNEAAEGSGNGAGLGVAGRAGILNSIAEA